jgi:hypothetical protein
VSLDQVDVIRIDELTGEEFSVSARDFYNHHYILRQDNPPPPSLP